MALAISSSYDLVLTRLKLRLKSMFGFSMNHLYLLIVDILLTQRHKVKEFGRRIEERLT